MASFPLWARTKSTELLIRSKDSWKHQVLHREELAKILKLISNLSKMRWKISFFLLSHRNIKDFKRIKVIVSLKMSRLLYPSKWPKSIVKNALKLKCNKILCLWRYLNNHKTIQILSIDLKVGKKVKFPKLTILQNEDLVLVQRETQSKILEKRIILLKILLPQFIVTEKFVRTL